MMKSISDSILRLYSLFLGYLRQLKERTYIDMVSKDSSWIVITYVTDIFFHQRDTWYLNFHQNRREALAMAQIVREKGYNVFVRDYRSRSSFPDLKVSAVIGEGPAFDKACKKYNQAIKVFYSTTAYYVHNNNQIKLLTDNFNSESGSHLKYHRLLPSNGYHELADHILMIGSKYTALTFPEHVRSKICPIHQSSSLINVLNNICYSCENEFFFMTSQGTILRGLPLLIDYFSRNKNLTLHVVGSLDSDYQSVLNKNKLDNVVFHGFMDINGEQIKAIMKRCNFIIYPSGSEGCPGSVINSMKNGLIPIVSRWAAFDEIAEYGYLLEDLSLSAIEKGVQWALSISPNVIAEMKGNVSAFVCETYSLERFSDEFRTFLDSILRN